MFDRHLTYGMIAVILTASPFSGALHADEARQIHIVGKGEMVVKADIAELSTTAYEMHVDKQAAEDSVVSRTAKLMKYLSSYSSDEAEVKLERMRLRTDFCRDGSDTTTYLVGKTVRVKLSNLTRLDELLAKCDDAGFTVQREIQWDYSEKDEAKEHLLDVACRDATQQAQAIAKRFGVRIGKPLRIESGNRQLIIQEASAPPVDPSKPLFEGDEVTIEDVRIETNVEAWFELR